MQYNVNNPSVKRILREVKEMEAEPSDQYTASPLEDNIFEWHFTIRGPKDTEFEGGLYHGRIILPPEYPFKPPNIVLLNESGRFEVGTKICLSISSYHPEHWQPSWSIRTVLVALISFMPTKGDGAIGALDLPAKDRKVLALKTPSFVCDKCGKRMDEVLSPLPVETSIVESTSSSNATTTTATTTTTTTTTSTEASSPSHEQLTSTNANVTSNTNANSASSSSSTSGSSSGGSASPTFYAPPPNTQPNTPPPIIQQPPAQSITPQPVHQSTNAQPITAQPPVMIRRYNINNMGYVHTNQPIMNQNENLDLNLNPNVVAGSVGNLDYIILAILLAIIGLLAKKFYGL